MSGSMRSDASPRIQPIRQVVLPSIPPRFSVRFNPLVVTIFGLLSVLIWVPAPGNRIFARTTRTARASISGRVRSSQGTPIAGASIVVREKNTGAERNLTTDESGAFQFQELPIGQCEVTISAPGFEPIVQPIDLASGVQYKFDFALGPHRSGTADESTTPLPTAEEIRQLKQQVESANQQIARLTAMVEALQARMPATPSASGEQVASVLTPASVQDSLTPSTGLPQTQPLQPSQSPVDKMIKSKMEGGQFSGAEGLLKNDRVKIGGYVDFRYVTRGLDDGLEIQENIDENNPDMTDVTNFKRNGFTTPQFVLAVAASLTDKLVFNSELEFEFAGAEVEVEQLYLEYRFDPKFNLRGGVIIPPLGRFNLFHDSNLRDIATRPLASTFVIPSTYKDAGIGANGEFNLGRGMKLGYEGYIVNGLRSDEGGEFAREIGLFESKGNNRFFDNNSQKSVVGRLMFSPKIGTELGASGYRGKHDNQGQYNLSIWSFDGKYTFRDFQIVGEYARAAVQRAPETVEEIAAKQFLLSLPKGDYVNSFEFIDSNLNNPIFDKPSRSLDGFFVEARYRFHPTWLLDRTSEDASIAPVFRYDQVNFDRQYPDFRFPLNIRRTSLGVSLRPTEAATFNFTYHHDTKPEIFLRLPDGRPFPPYFTNLGGHHFSFGMAYAF